MDRYILHLMKISVRLITAMFCLNGCLGENPTHPLTPDSSKLYASLRLDHRAIVLSVHPPYDTVQLHAVPYSLSGTPLETVDQVIYRRLNPLDESVDVDSEGRLTAKRVTNASKVLVSASIGSVTWEDTAIVMVRDELPIRFVQQIEFGPLPPDSAWRWAGTKTLIQYENWTRALDASDNIIEKSQLVIDYNARNQLVTSTKSLNDGASGIQSPFRDVIGGIGETYIVADLQAYGRVLRDSFLFKRVDPPVRFMVVDRVVPADRSPELRIFPDTIEIQSGTTIAFFNRWGTNEFDPFIFGEFSFCVYSCGNRVTYIINIGGSEKRFVDSVDIIFDGPEVPQAGQPYVNIELQIGNFTFSDTSSGNIDPFSAVLSGFVQHDSGIRTRRFVTPGVYAFHSTKFPSIKGVIRVRN